MNMSNRTDFIKEEMFGKVLDIGCEEGELHSLINNKNVYGLDLNPKRQKERVTKGNAENLPYKDSVFDTLISGELIEHLENPDNFLKESKRVLKNNGIIIITTPNKNSWINLFFRSSHIKSHHNLFDMHSLKKVVENYFIIEKVFCLPYDRVSSFGSKHKWSFVFRKIIHKFIPQFLQEEIIVKGRKT